MRIEIEGFALRVSVKSDISPDASPLGRYETKMAPVPVLYRGGSRKFRKRVTGTLAHLLSRYFLFIWEFYRNKTKFKRKGGGRDPLAIGPRLNPPLL